MRILEKSRLVDHVPRKGAYVTALDEASVESMGDIEKTNNIIITATAPATVNDKDAFYNSVVEFAPEFSGTTCNDRK